MYFVWLITLGFIVPGIFAQSLTVDPATANLGEDALMTFTFTPASGDDLLFLTWYTSDAAGVLGNNIISNITGNMVVNGRYSLNSEGGIIISNVEVQDAGHYLCRVTTANGNNADGFSTLTVYYLYNPVLSSFATPVNEGDMVQMSCSADANPAPTSYTFKKDGVVQQPDGGSSTLTFQSVSRNNDGSYECEASNSAGTMISDSRLLEVYYAPEITPLSMQVPPGATVVISFDVVAKPTANYVWTTSPATTDTDNNPDTYTFTVSENIEETYTVMMDASNDVGATQASVEVKVVAPTSTSTSTSATSTTPTSTSIASTSATNIVVFTKAAQEYSCSDTGTGLVVGMIFLGIFIGILLSSSVFVVVGKMRNSKPQVTEVTSKNDKQPAAYMAYRGEPNTENQTYEDLQWNDNDNPVVYVNVKVKKERKDKN